MTATLRALPEPWQITLNEACKDLSGPSVVARVQEEDVLSALATVVVGRSQNIEAALRELGLTRKSAREIIAAARQLRKSMVSADLQRSHELEEFTDSAAPSTIELGEWSTRLPPGYTVSGTSLWNDDGPIARTHIALVERFEEVGTEDDSSRRESYRIAWMHYGEVRHTIVPAERLKTGREIVAALGQFGAPVNQNNARDIIDYFELQSGYLPESSTFARTCGWIPDSTRFALPNWDDLTAPHAVEVSAIPECQAQARAYRRRGTWEGYLQMLGQLDDVPEAWGAIYASCAPVLMVPVGTTMGCMLSLAAPSGSGKTRILMVAAASWGRPSTDGMILNWNTTTAGLERSLEFADSTALFMDETQQAQSLQQVTECLYQTANGGGRNRYTTSRSSFHAMIVTTGEQSLMSLTTERGAQNRILEYQLPSDHRSPGYFFTSADACDQVTAGAQDHHGHLGPRFVEYVSRADWASLRSGWREHTSNYRDRGLDTRLADLLGLLSLARQIIHVCLGVPRPDLVADPIEMLAASTVQTRTEYDAESDALRTLRDAANVYPPRSLFGSAVLTEQMRLIQSMPTVSEAREILRRADIPKPGAMLKRLEERGMIRKYTNMYIAGKKGLSWIEFVD